jgi:hypothetical protein
MGESLSLITVDVEVPQDIVEEARQRSAAGDSKASLDEFLLDQIRIELNYEEPA